MKRILFFMLSLLFISELASQNSIAQSYTRWSLPHGAQARLGKGRISGNIAYSPDGSQLVVASGCGIWLYDTRIGIEVDLLTGHTGVVSSVSFSPDGNTLASCARSDSTVRLWDTATGQLKDTLEGWAYGEGDFVLFSPDGRTLAHGDALRLWDTTTGQYRHVVVGEDNIVVPCRGVFPGRSYLSGERCDFIGGDWDRDLRVGRAHRSAQATHSY